MPPYRKFPPPHRRCTAPAAAPPARYPPARYSAPHILQPHNLRPIFGKSPTRRTVERQRPIFRTELPRQRPSPSCAQGHAGFTRPRHSTIFCHQPTGSNRAPFIGTASICTRGKDQFFSQKDKKSLSLPRCNRPPRSFPCPFRASHPPHTIFITHLYQRKDSS